MDTITIERIDPANAHDVERFAPGVATVINAIVAEGENTALPGRMSSEQVRDLIRELGDRGGIFYALVRDHVVAFALLRPEENEEDVARLGVWVLPEHRRRGLGLELSRVAIEFASDAGYKKLQGTIPPDNEPALSFFSAVSPIAMIEGEGMQYELPV